MTSINDSLARASKGTQGCVRPQHMNELPDLDPPTLAAKGASAPGTLFDYKIWQVVLAASVGTVIEWYDFFIIGSLTAVLALKFYPPGNTTVAYLAYLATFAIGLVVRPFGALFFGRIGDLTGRKYAFLVTLIIMGGATAGIGLLPTYATAGWFAPSVLIAMRVLQGISLGGA